MFDKLLNLKNILQQKNLFNFANRIDEIIKFANDQDDFSDLDEDDIPTGRFHDDNFFVEDVDEDKFSGDWQPLDGNLIRDAFRKGLALKNSSKDDQSAYYSMIGSNPIYRQIVDLLYRAMIGSFKVNDIDSILDNAKSQNYDLEKFKKEILSAITYLALIVDFKNLYNSSLENRQEQSKQKMDTASIEDIIEYNKSVDEYNKSVDDPGLKKDYINPDETFELSELSLNDFINSRLGNLVWISQDLYEDFQRL